MKLTIDVKNTRNHISDAELDALLRESAVSLETLCAKTGRGNDFLGWLDLDNPDKNETDRIKKAAKKIISDSDALVVIGIGGSYLGARAALDFIKSPNYNNMKKDTPDIYFAGNGFSADGVAQTLSMIGDRDFSINVISKSGTTTEPAVAFRIFREALEKKYGKKEAAKRIYATTDKAKGALKSLADKDGYETFVIPDDVGGRFSVFTPVGYLPLAAAGIDIDDLVSGIKSAYAACKTPNAENPAMKYAAVRNGLYRAGRSVEIFADFEPALRFAAEWWKQLYGESEGKEGKGIFPASVDFTADLHSMGQYIQQGARLMFETFVKVKNSEAEITVPYDEDDGDGLNYLAGRDMTWINHKALEATMQAHLNGDVPNMLITVPDRSARSFGELASFFEVACGISGYMLGVNPFDQPGVEDYKKLMFILLGKPGYN